MIRFSGISDEAGQSIDVQIRAHKVLGWRYIELRSIDGINVTNLCDRAFDAVCARIDAAGLRVSAFASQLCNWARPILTHEGVDIDELQRAIPRMRRLGTEFIRIMSYPNAGWPEDEWRDEVVRRIRLLARLAEDGGVVLAHENCDGWGGQSPEHALRLLELVGSPALVLLYDTGNPVAHGQDPADFWSKVRDHVRYVHIKDGRRRNGAMNYSSCGDGDGIIPRVLADLKDSNYDGFVSIEPHLAAIIHEAKQAENADLAFDSYIAYGRRLMDLTRSAGA